MKLFLKMAAAGLLGDYRPDYFFAGGNPCSRWDWNGDGVFCNYRGGSIGNRVRHRAEAGGLRNIIGIHGCCLAAFSNLFGQKGA